MLIMLAALIALAPDPATAVPTPQNDPRDPVVCHRPDISEVGTHMRAKPVCMKRSEWQLVEQNTRNQLQTLREHNSFDPGRGAPPR